MGRQQICSVQRQAAASHQSVGNSKQHPQQLHPLPKRPSSPPFQRPQSPQQSRSPSTPDRSRPHHNQRLQQQQHHQQRQPKPASINIEQSHHSIYKHPGNGFDSGVWLLDQSRVPQWMAPHLPKQQVPLTHFSRNQSPLSPKGNRAVSPRLPSPKVLALPPASHENNTANNKNSTRLSSPTSASPKSPSLQYGDDTFLWHGWSQWSGKPLWQNNQVTSALNESGNQQLRQKQQLHQQTTKHTREQVPASKSKMIDPSEGKQRNSRKQRAQSPGR